jgi:hypothetical protein
MEGRSGKGSCAGSSALGCAGHGTMRTDGHDQNLVDSVRGEDVDFGVALPSGGTMNEYQPHMRCRHRDQRRVVQLRPARESDWGY